MIRLEKTTDITQILTALRTNNMYKGIYNIKHLPETFKPDLVGVNWYQLYKNKKPYGLLYLREVGDKYIMFHGGIYKRFRGSKSVKRAKEVLQLIKEKYPEKIMATSVYKDNTKANNFVTKLGYICVDQVQDYNLYINRGVNNG